MKNGEDGQDFSFFFLQGLAAISESGHADTTASATEPRTPVPGASVDPRETMMCAPPEAGTQDTLAQAEEDSLWVRMSEPAAGITKAWPAVASEMRAADVFILGVVVVVVLRISWVRRVISVNWTPWSRKGVGKGVPALALYFLI